MIKLLSREEAGNSYSILGFPLSYTFVQNMTLFNIATVIKLYEISTYDNRRRIAFKHVIKIMPFQYRFNKE